MSINDVIQDDIVGHSVDLQRLEESVKRQIRGELKKLEKALVKELRTTNGLTAKRLNVLLAQSRSIIADSYKDIASKQTKMLIGVAGVAERQAVKVLNDAIQFELASVTMSKNQLKAIVSNTLIEGAPSKEWWSRRGQAYKAKFSDTIRQGMMRGDDTRTITRNLIGTTKNKFKDGALQANRRSAEALVRTSIQTVANESRLMTYAENDDVIKAVEWVSTLDSRTTQTCMSLDGLQWSNPERKPIGHSVAFVGATAHWGCRSTQTPVTKSWKELGAKGKFKEIPESTRASMDGQVSDKLTYEGWLKKKPKAFQEDVLGVKKRQLWKDGKLGFTDLINQSGNPLTLEQLGIKLAKPKKIVKPTVAIDKPVKEIPNIHMTNWGKLGRKKIEPEVEKWLEIDPTGFKKAMKEVHAVAGQYDKKTYAKALNLYGFKYHPAVAKKIKLNQIAQKKQLELHNKKWGGKVSNSFEASDIATAEGFKVTGMSTGNEVNNYISRYYKKGNITLRISDHKPVYARSTGYQKSVYYDRGNFYINDEVDMNLFTETKPMTPKEFKKWLKKE